MNRYIHYCAAALLFLGTAVAAQGQSLQEQQWATAIENSASAPDMIWLGEGDSRFLGLFKEEITSAPRGAVILLHSMGAHPDWPRVIHPLRETLTDYGWHTLSIQMPLPDTSSASINDYPGLYDSGVARILTAIKYLRDHDIHNIVLLGYELGAAQAAAYLANNPDPQVVAYIGINMPKYLIKDPHFDTLHNLEFIRLPVLDVFGTQGPPSVVSYARQRTLAARRSGNHVTQEQKLDAFSRSAVAQSSLTRKAGFIAYRQFAIPAADATFYGFDDYLSKRIGGWLARHASGTRIDKGIYNNITVRQAISN